MYKYKVGDSVHILPKDQLGRPEHFDPMGKMYQYCDRVATVMFVDDTDCIVKVDIDHQEWFWHKDNIEPAQQVYTPEIHALTLFL